MQDTLFYTFVYDRYRLRHQRFRFLSVRGVRRFFEDGSQSGTRAFISQPGLLVLSEPFVGRFECGQHVPPSYSRIWEQAIQFTANIEAQQSNKKADFPQQIY
jgi:hypothetical protein